MGDQQELYGVWRPVWIQEEQRREKQWNEVLLRNTIRESGKTYDLAGLAELGLQDVITQAQHEDSMRPTLDALVSSGFPTSIRGNAWKCLLDVSVRRHRGHYNALVTQSLGVLAGKEELLTVDEIKQHLAQTADSPGVPPTAGAQADAAWQAQAKVWLQQIEKDLPRTFSNHPVMQGLGRQALRRVLAAFAMHDPVIGYCQGMNYIAAVLLMFMSEEDAFWCLVIVVEEILAGYFSPDMMAAKVDQRVFQQLVNHQLPVVDAHLESVGADLACVAPQWFLCAFVNSLPLETCLRVWDIMFYRKSSAILFQVGLALVDVYQEALMAARDVLEAFQVVQGMAALTHDASHLLAVARVKYASLDDQHLLTLRAQAQAQVEKQDAEDEKAEAGRLRQLQQQEQQQRQLQQQEQQPQPQPDSRLTVVKKLLARLDKRIEPSGLGGGSGSGRQGGSKGSSTNLADRVSGNGTSAGPESDTEHDPTRVRRLEAAAAGDGRGQGKRAGDHTVPDSNDSPLLKEIGSSKPPYATGSEVPAREGQEEEEEEGGSYVPPSVPLFPEAKELISLSPEESNALPDIDDLLSATSAQHRRGISMDPSPWPGGPSADPCLSPAQTSDATQGEGKGCDQPPLAAGSQGASSGSSATPGGEGQGVSLTVPASGDDASNTHSILPKDSKLQALDAMLWHDTPPWKSLQQFSAAQRSEGTPTRPQATDDSHFPPVVEQAAIQGHSFSSGSVTGGEKPGTVPAARQDAVMDGPASSGSASNLGSSGTWSKPPQPTQLSPAMQLALRIAMHKPDNDSPPAPAPAAPAVSLPIQAPTAPMPPRPSAPQAITETAAAVWRQAGWGLGAPGVIPASHSPGMSSVPTEDLHDPLSIGNLGSGIGGASFKTGLNGTGSWAGAELKDDWVDLHVGEDLMHVSSGRKSQQLHQQQNHPQQTVRGWPAGQQQPGSGDGTFPLLSPHPLHHPLQQSQGPHQLSQSQHHIQPHGIHQQQPQPNLGAQRVPELRKTISNGWVDGALATQSTGMPASQSSSGGLPMAPPLLTQITQSMPHPVTASSPHPPLLPGMSSLPGFFPVPLAPLNREGLAQHGVLDHGPLGSGDGLLEASQLQMPISGPTPEVVEELCKREGIQPLLTRCHNLNGQHSRLAAERLGSQHPPGGSDDDADPEPSQRHPLGMHSAGTSRALLAQQKHRSGDLEPVPSDYHRLLTGLMEHVGEALAQVNLLVKGAGGELGSGSGDAGNGSGGGTAEGAGVGKAAATAAFSLQAAHQQLSEALESAVHVDKVEQELLRSYRGLANSACQKLHDVAGKLAEKEAVAEALSLKMHALTQVYHAKEERLNEKLSDQDDALKDMRQRLSTMATSNTASGGGLTGGAEGSRILGAFQKLRERNSRPSSPPPVARRNTPPPGVQPLLVPQGVEHPGAGWQQSTAVAMAGEGNGTPGGQQNATVATKGEGQVTKWLNRFMKKDDDEGAA